MEYCMNCQHFDAHHPMYRNGYTEMDNCQDGWEGIPVYEKCPIKSSLTRIVYQDSEIAGYLAIHYVQDYHHFTDIERKTIEEFTRILSISLSRFKARQENRELKLLQEYQKELQVNTEIISGLASEYLALYYINMKEHNFKVYSLDKKLSDTKELLTKDTDAFALIRMFAKSPAVHPDDREQFEVMTEESVKRRLDGIKKFSIIVDWQMPGMDGVELTRKVREIFGSDNIILIASAYNLADIKDEGKKAGANFFINKPLFQSTLFNLLVTVTRGIDFEAEEKTRFDRYDFSGRRVLLAEDVVLNMEVAIKLLKLVGLDVVCAEDGKQAVDIYEKSDDNYFDCILMDVNMPVMDGYEATKAIRSSSKPDAKKIPIYAMTANAFNSDIAAALDAGMNGHVAKPIEADILYSTLNDAFENKEEHHESL